MLRIVINLLDSEVNYEQHINYTPRSPVMKKQPKKLRKLFARTLFDIEFHVRPESKFCFHINPANSVELEELTRNLRDILLPCYYK